MAHIKPSNNKGSKFLDKMVKTLGLKNDAALARALQCTPVVLSHIRHSDKTMPPNCIIRTHKLTGWPILQIEKELGIKNDIPSLQIPQ